jgi:hypothetical protein
VADPLDVITQTVLKKYGRDEAATPEDWKTIEFLL